MHQAQAPLRRLLFVSVAILALSAHSGAGAMISGPAQISAST